MSALRATLDAYRKAATSEREKGNYFEELTRAYLLNEATYRDLCTDVRTHAAWARQEGLTSRHRGIDFVASAHDESGAQ